MALLSAACDAARSTPPETLVRCQQCHGEASGNAAPPRSLGGATDRTARGVGAHQVHVQGGPVRGPLDCGECHPLPDAQHPMSHPDGRLEVVFGALGQGGGSPTWSGNQLTCSATYCHGGSLGAGGALTVPTWTAVDGSASACGACHGNPPPRPHPANSACASCHPQTVRPDGTIDLASGTHVNGSVEVTGLSCQSCHGGRGNAAPPVGTNGETATTTLAVGAHQAHVRDGSLHAALGCDACHPVPDQPLHSDGAVTVAFGNLAQAGGASPTWARGGATCASTYCHGTTLAAGGVATTPVWTRVDGSQRTCDSCHGAPPSTVAGRAHPLLSRCADCHPDTVRADGTIDVAGGKHINGSPDVRFVCDACHGAPPATGAHLAHARPPRVSGMAYGEVTVLEDVALPGDDPAPYAFGCGQCHPIDPARHMDGRIDVDLSPAGAPAGSLKSRNRADAAWNRAAGSCTGVACHSSGQASPAFAAVPAWSAAGPLACSSCHDNPPRYPSGGPGAPDANGHLQLQADFYEWGHFGGLPGPWHGSKHGVAPGTVDAAPITCQACHAGTVDPAGSAPGGFFWLDTTGDYQLPGGFLAYRCGDCHGAPGGPPTGAGRVLALKHANGRRDVAFDDRPDLPVLPWLPVPPSRPSRPYWVTTGTAPQPIPPGAVIEGTTLSMRLGGAGWEPTTKTCSSVACHGTQTSVVWGAPHDGYNACATCHTGY
jgi:predicted CxxxxCH...CXXCH cytochrome family protein